MRTLHLFAGAGGGLLADLILGHTPVCAVEWDAAACRILRERSAEGWFPGLHVHEGDVRAFDLRPWAGRVDCLAAGFPCQDISAAGRGAGIDGARSGLVWEIFRAIDEIRPRFVFLENSPNIRTKGRDRIVTELVARGYAWRDGKIGAADVGAGHQRDRWFLLAADVAGIGNQRGALCSGRYDTSGAAARWAQGESRAESRIEDAAYTLCNRLQGQSRAEDDCARFQEASDCAAPSAADRLRDRLQVAVQRGGLSETDAATIQAAAGYVGGCDWSPPDVGVCRVVDGLASRMDRIKCCGNGQVPLQAAAAFILLSAP